MLEEGVAILAKTVTSVLNKNALPHLLQLL